MELQDFLKSKNPNENEQHILIYGKEYKLWRDGKYIGTATWTKDDNLGDSFQKSEFKPSLGRNIQQVFIADAWELIIKK